MADMRKHRNRIVKMVYCKYDGMIVKKFQNGEIKVQPICDCPDLKEAVKQVDYFSSDYISYFLI